jgi:hypothetical protein
VATHISAAALLILRIVLVNRGADVTNTFDHNGSPEGLLGRQDNMVTSVVAPCPRAVGGNVLGILSLRFDSTQSRVGAAAGHGREL